MRRPPPLIETGAFAVVYGDHKKADIDGRISTMRKQTSHSVAAIGIGGS